MPKKLSGYDSEKIKKALSMATTLTGGFLKDEIECVAGVVEVLEYEAGELIITEESSYRDIMIIAEGKATVHMKLGPTGATSESLCKVQDYGIVGEMSFIDGSLRSANVKAIEKSIVFRLPYDEMSDLCEARHTMGYKIAWNIAKLISQRMRNLNSELRFFLFK